MKNNNEKVEEFVQVPDGIQVSVNDNEIFVKGPQGEAKRKFVSLITKIALKNNSIIISSVRSTKKNKKNSNAIISHIKNMLNGVKNQYVYKLKICSSHFPINASVSGNKFIVKNFLGEKLPRELLISQNVEVKVGGDEISVKSCDLELAGETASRIELLTAIRQKDRRVFQDGVFITEKPKKGVLA